MSENDRHGPAIIYGCGEARGLQVCAITALSLLPQRLNVVPLIVHIAYRRNSEAQ